MKKYLFPIDMYISGLMPNLIKKSWTVSNQNLQAIEAKPVESKNLVVEFVPQIFIFSSGTGHPAGAT